MCVHATVMRQTRTDGEGTERLIVHLFSDLNTTRHHALPDDDVPLREEVVPIHDIRVTFAPGYRVRPDPPRAGRPRPGTGENSQGVRTSPCRGWTSTRWSWRNSTPRRNRDLWIQQNANPSVYPTHAITSWGLGGYGQCGGKILGLATALPFLS